MSAQSILDWALQTGLSISILVLLIMLVRKPVARYLGAKAAYGLWALPVIRLFLPALPILPAKTLPAVSPAPPMADFIVIPNLSTAPAAQGLDPAVMLISIWLIGAALYLAWQAAAQLRFRKQVLVTTRPVTPEVMHKFDQLADDLNLQSTPLIRQATDNQGPLVAGLMKPVIILPKNFETDFTPGQQNHALAHELSHVRSGDLWMAASALLFRALNWPNPLIHLAAPRFRADQEAACDARVIAMFGDDRSTKTAYADTLLKAARLSHHHARPLPLGLTISNPLKERLMILKTNPNPKLSLRLALGGAAAAALLATAPLTTAQTAPTPPATPETTVTAKSVDKQVMKWVTNENGVETKKHVEIITEDGITTAWEIDEIGNRIQVPVDSVDIRGPEHHSGQMRIVMKSLGDGSQMDIDIDELAGEFAGDKRVIVKRLSDLSELEALGELKALEGLKNLENLESLSELGEGQNVIIMESHDFIDVESDGQNSFVFHSGDSVKSHPGMMVDVASNMLEGINTDDMDREARKKVEAAQKALKEAQEALAESE